MLEVGPWQIPRDIVHRLHSRTDEEEAAAIEARYVEDEQLFQLAVAMDWLDADMRRHLDDLEGDVLLGTLMQRRVEAFLEEPSEEVLRAFAASRSRPLHKRKQMRLDLLQAPIPNQGDPIVFLDDLEGLAERLRDGEIDFQEASDELPPDGSVTELPLLDIIELAGGHLEPLLFEAIADLPAGSVTAPIQLGRDFYIVAVREVVPGRDRSFEEAREDLHRLWVQERRRELRESIAAAALERFGFRLTPEGEAKLASLSAAAPEAGSEEEVP